MSCPTHRAGLNVTATARTDIPETVRPVTDADAYRAVLAAIENMPIVTVGVRDIELQHRAWQQTGHVAVWDSDEDDTAPGRHYALTLTPLTYCDSHDRYHPTRDRLCDLCVFEQTREDI